jgi:hypothetical protein
MAEQIKKLLIGMKFNGAGISRVLRRLKGVSPTVAGVQVGENYEEREKYGIVPPNVIQVIHYLRKGGAEVVPLEDEELLQKNLSAMYARAAVSPNNSLTKEELEGKLSDCRTYISMYEERDETLRSFMDPSAVYADRRNIGILESALAILEGEPDLTTVEGLWAKSNESLQAGMLERIEARKPDLVIVGFSHADRLTEHLPEYEYVRILEGE